MLDAYFTILGHGVFWILFGILFAIVYGIGSLLCAFILGEEGWEQGVTWRTFFGVIFWFIYIGVVALVWDLFNV